MLLFYAIARRRPAIEFYVPIRSGQAIGWTDDLGAAWCIERPDWADAVLAEVVQHGHFDAFVYVFRGELEG